MKKLIFKLLAITLVVSFTSCNEEYKDDNDDTLADRTTVAYFAESGSTLFVKEEEVGKLDVLVSVSEAKPYDRTFTVSVDEAATTAVAGGFDYEDLNLSNLVVPANAQYGSFTVTAGDFNNSTVQGVNLVFNLDDVQDATLDYRLTHTVKIQRFCPIYAPFAGEYLIEEITPISADGPVLNHLSVVTLYTLPGSETKRAFMTNNFPNFCTTPNQFVIDLVCEEILMPVGGNQGNCVCEQGIPYIFGTAPTPTTFDPNDDSAFEVSFENDVTGNCGPSVITTYRFTKQ